MSMRLMEYQLSDVRTALERYHHTCEAQMEDDYEWDEKTEKEYVVRRKTMYHDSHERQALLDLVERIVEIATHSRYVDPLERLALWKQGEMNLIHLKELEGRLDPAS
jgi:hypothetical protein